MKTYDKQRLSRYRLKDGHFGSTDEIGNSGAFFVPGPERATLKLIASDYGEWEHVSVSVHKKQRCPTWQEMCFVKDLFWDESEVVVQYHPAKSNYINHHEYVLHLWRPKSLSIPMPPLELV